MDIKKNKGGNITQVPTNQRLLSSVLGSTVSKTVVQSLPQDINSCINRKWLFI